MKAIVWMFVLLLANLVSWTTARAEERFRELESSRGSAAGRARGFPARRRAPPAPALRGPGTSRRLPKPAGAPATGPPRPRRDPRCSHRGPRRRTRHRTSRHRPVPLAVIQQTRCRGTGPRVGPAPRHPSPSAADGAQVPRGLYGVVEPPTRRGLTSTAGVTVRRA